MQSRPRLGETMRARRLSAPEFRLGYCLDPCALWIQIIKTARGNAPGDLRARAQSVETLRALYCPLATGESPATVARRAIRAAVAGPLGGLICQNPDQIGI